MLYILEGGMEDCKVLENKFLYLKRVVGEVGIISISIKCETAFEKTPLKEKNACLEQIK